MSRPVIVRLIHGLMFGNFPSFSMALRKLNVYARAATRLTRAFGLAAGLKGDLHFTFSSHASIDAISENRQPFPFHFKSG